MVDFANAKFETKPKPLTITIAPTVKGSNVIQMQLQPLPQFSITYTPDGSGWQKFNASTLKHVTTTIIDVITPFISSTLQDKAQKVLNDKAQVTIPPIPVSVDGIDLTITPTSLNISSPDTDHVLVTAVPNIS
ncbi:hypothetical protein P4S72_17215 [Vibrio sp. PP-XX7]